MAHIKETHIDLIHKLCRTCGNLAQTWDERRQNRKIAKCVDNAFNIQAVFGIDIAKDDNDIHSQHICKKCMLRMTCILKRKSDTNVRTAHKDASQTKDIWHEYDATILSTSCRLCVHHSELSKGLKKSCTGTKNY